ASDRPGRSRRGCGDAGPWERGPALADAMGRALCNACDLNPEIKNARRVTGSPSHLTIVRRHLTASFQVPCRVNVQHDTASVNAARRGEARNATTEPIVLVLGPVPPGNPHGA